MIRLLLVFVALFAAGLVCVFLLPSPPKVVAPDPVVATQWGQDAKASDPQPNVRVVYPASGTSNEPNDSIQKTSRGLPSIDPAAAKLAVAKSEADPQMVSVAPVTAAVAPTTEAATVATQGLNLNTASIEALNQIPGAGHIGRTIAAHRPYRSVEDLLAKRVVRKSVYDRIKAEVAAE